jgi:hypothetical protein
MPQISVVQGILTLSVVAAALVFSFPRWYASRTFHPLGNGPVTLRYFNSKGRAEVARLMLHDCGVPFDDVRLNREQWLRIKHELRARVVVVVVVVVRSLNVGGGVTVWFFYDIVIFFLWIRCVCSGD